MLSMSMFSLLFFNGVALAEKNKMNYQPLLGINLFHKIFRKSKGKFGSCLELISLFDSLFRATVPHLEQMTFWMTF